MNKPGRAYEMWKLMMQAGENYMKGARQRHTTMPTARSNTYRGRLAV